MRWFYLRDTNRRLIGCVASAIATRSGDIFGVRYTTAICSQTDNYPEYRAKAFKEHARSFAVGRLILDTKVKVVMAPKGEIARTILDAISADQSMPNHARAAAELWFEQHQKPGVPPTKIIEEAAEYGNGFQDSAGPMETQINADTDSTISALEQAERIAEVAADVGIALPTEPEPVYVFHAPPESPHPSSDDAALDRLFSDFHGDHSHHH